MVCIYCGGPTQVINSRLQRRSNQTWRRRKCQDCRSIFTTQERAELSGALMVQKQHKLEPFYREKLFLSIYESCRHRSQAVLESINLAEQVIGRLMAEPSSGSLSRQKIVDHVISVLKPYDKLAASVYEAFHS